MKLKTNVLGGSLLRSGLMIGASALALATPALAQAQATPAPDAPVATSQSTNTPTSAATPEAAAPLSTSSSAPSTEPTAVKEVVVTGSLFRRTNTETPSPVTVLSANQIAKQGLTSITDAVRSISADNSGTIPNAFSNGFAAGASGVALRGLTAADTLVLIDGLRTANYPVADDGVRSFVDLNTIPLINVDRVEVLKDGASSIYGSDAVAGVVNIITKQTFKGFEADASYGDSQHGGGQETRGSFILGHGDLATDGWNAYISGEYQSDQDITNGQRGFPYNTTDLSSIGGLNNIAGQPGLNTGSIYGNVAPATGPNAGVFQPLRACGPGSTPTTGGAGSYCTQNFATYGDSQPAEIRWDLSGRFTKQINGDTQVFATFTYANNKINAYTSPSQIQSGSPINTNGITLPAMLSNGALNPNNPFAAMGEAASINYAFGDIPASSAYDNQVYRGVLGIKGEAFGWNYEGDLTSAHSALSTTIRGDIDYNQLQEDIANGAYSFINPSSNSAAVRNALSPAIAKTSVNNLDSLDVHASRDLYQLPGGPLSLAIGGQFRYEYQADPNLNPLTTDVFTGASEPTYIGLGLATTNGHRNVGAVFFELDAPVDKTLDLDFSGRYDHYSDFGGNFAPKIGVKWQPSPQLAFRATYSQGFRAPSFSQNGASASTGFVTIESSALPASFVAAHGNDAYVQSYSLAEANVSNANLKPESSQSFTGGVIYEPFRWINISVDYYHIHQTNIIAATSPSEVLADYYAGLALPAGSKVIADIPDPNAPGQLARAAEVESPYENSNELTTDGLDIDARANYRLPFDVHFTSELNVTDIFGYEYTSAGQTFNYVGTEAPYNLSSGAGTPKYRANWSNSLTWQKATITGTLNYTSDFKETGVDVTNDASVVDACLYPGVSASCRVRAFYDFDLTGSYQLTPQVEIYANVLNLLDADAPLDPANYAGTNYNPTYDQAGIVGRFFRVGAHVKF